MCAPDDPTVSLDNSLLMFQARRRQKPRRRYTYSKAGHGFGWRSSNDPSVAAWPNLFPGMEAGSTRFVADDLRRDATRKTLNRDVTLGVRYAYVEDSIRDLKAWARHDPCTQPSLRLERSLVASHKSSQARCTTQALQPDSNEPASYCRRQTCCAGTWHGTLHEYIVDTAGNGKEALESLMRSPPALVVTDIVMPEFDGMGCSSPAQHAPHADDSGVAHLGRAIHEHASGLQGGADGYWPNLHGHELRACIGSMLPSERAAKKPPSEGNRANRAQALASGRALAREHHGELRKPTKRKMILAILRTNAQPARRRCATACTSSS